MNDQLPGKQIYLFGEEPLDISNTKGKLRRMAKYINGFTSDGLPEGLERRANPSWGDMGRINLSDVCTEAVVKTIMNGIGLEEAPPEYVYQFLNPSKMGLPETPYKDKLPVLIKIINEFKRCHYGGHTHFNFAGGIYDQTHSFLAPQSEQTPFFWIENTSTGNEYEALFNTEKSDTHFMFKDTFSRRGVFRELRKRHESENLFSKGPISFTMHLGWRWHIPIMGITKVSATTYEQNDFYIQTILSKEGVEVKELDINNPRDFYRIKYLKPQEEGYYERSI